MLIAEQGGRLAFPGALVGRIRIGRLVPGFKLRVTEEALVLVQSMFLAVQAGLVLQFGVAKPTPIFIAAVFPAPETAFVPL